jgi:putative Holliday junction resolvase
MKCLGMDLGTRTLGLATSDRLGLIASPYKTIRYEDTDKLVDEVLDIIKNEKIEVLVLGYPKNMNNTLGEAVERTMVFKEKLEAKCDLKINLIDERLSTVEATNYLLNEDMSRKGRKRVVDAVAASIILDTYLRKVEIDKQRELGN